MESRLRARIAALAEAEPALADDLALRGALIELLDAAELGTFELRLPGDLARARLAAGVPLLDRLDLPISSSVAALAERLAVAMLADPATRQPAKAMLVALRGHQLHAEQLVGEAVVGHDDHLTALAEAAAVSHGLVVWVADLAARGLLAAVAERLRPVLSLGAWDRSYCPICGGRPLLAERSLPTDTAASPSPTQCRDESPPSPSRGEGGWGVGETSLRCGRCASGWVHPMRLCPDCRAGQLTVLDRLDVADLGRWALTGCDRCPAYLKIAASARSGRLADLLLDDLATWRLDRLAVEQGRERQSGTGYRLEHGEPAGEELDDD